MDGPPEPGGAPLAGLGVRVRGVVQGVGFRPFVWTTARELGLSGEVFNDEAGVQIALEGPPAGLDAFLTRLRREAPPLARIDAVETTPLSPNGRRGFSISISARRGAAATAIPPDAATCPDCLAEIFDPGDRRYLYPFTNCTHCGPRFTITRALPYDRAQTSMAAFAMCPACQAEYDDPGDRRFHAQPNACPDCGPRLSATPAEIAARLQAGEILAVKGLGGFHLACDARNPAAVERLRARKQRDGKPFAVMVAGLASARLLAEIEPVEAALLTSRARPIVICRARAGAGIAPGVANGLPTLGLMLPYTPVHHLIFHAGAGAPAGLDWLEAPQPFALVMTSANPGGEPLATDNADAARRLGAIADGVVSHDRDIVVRCDDSVMRVIDGAPAYLRRARGAAPEPIKLPYAVPPTLALGAHLKSAVCVTRGDEAFLSQHIGDLVNSSVYGFYRETIDHLLSILEVSPERVACDLYPDFLSTRYAQESGLPAVRVQHHHAHAAAALAEHGLEGPVAALVLDGFGLADDGRASWGGELLVSRAEGSRRIGGLAPLAQPGGDAAARAPWRMGAAALHALGRTHEIARRYEAEAGAETVAAMLQRGVNAPPTSSAGRYFDAAGGLLGVKPRAAFEAEAPMALEGLVRAPRVLADGWRITDSGDLDLSAVLLALTEAGPQDGAELFHGTLAAALADWTARAIAAEDLPAVAIASGGCLQNKVLSEALAAELAARGVEILRPALAPANDGGLALGQAWTAGNSQLTE